MNDSTIIKLKEMAYRYCLERRYVGGVDIQEINKSNYEKLSGFINWLDTEINFAKEQEVDGGNHKNKTS